MSDEDAGAVAPEPVKRGPGRPRKEERPQPEPVVTPPMTAEWTVATQPPQRVRLLRPVQLNSECFVERPERPAKLQAGDTALLQYAVAAGLIASGKAVAI